MKSTVNNVYVIITLSIHKPDTSQDAKILTPNNIMYFITCMYITIKAVGEGEGEGLLKYVRLFCD